MPRLLRKFFTTKDGKLVVWQKPNLPIVGWAVFTVLARAFPDNSLVHLLAGGFILVWAILEVSSGVNYFRRTLGFIVLAWSLAAIFW